MPKLCPISQRVLIKKLRLLGFEGPYSGGKHQFMIKNNFKLTVPNLHNKDIGIILLSKIIKELTIPIQDFINL
ncbi:MAG: type II toxin-antitoxin system HicA family toxin [Patescibacteria group bacterium]